MHICGWTIEIMTIIESLKLILGVQITDRIMILSA